MNDRTDIQARRRPLGPYAVAPIGFGAMRLTGPNVFGPPKDRRAAIAVLRDAVESGVDHIDTAQFYGPNVVNELIREALHPYPPELVLVSKVGARRDGRGGIFADDAPARASPRHGRQPPNPWCRHRSRSSTFGSCATHRTGRVLRRSAQRHDLGPRRRLDQGDRSQQHHARAPAPRPRAHRGRLRAERLPPGQPRLTASRRRVHPTRHRVRAVRLAGLRCIGT